MRLVKLRVEAYPSGVYKARLPSESGNAFGELQSWYSREVRERMSGGSAAQQQPTPAKGRREP